MLFRGESAPPEFMGQPRDSSVQAKLEAWDRPRTIAALKDYFRHATPAVPDWYVETVSDDRMRQALRSLNEQFE
jgi:hypothetical protein